MNKLELEEINEEVRRKINKGDFKYWQRRSLLDGLDLINDISDERKYLINMQLLLDNCMYYETTKDKILKPVRLKVVRHLLMVRKVRKQALKEATNLLNRLMNKD